ncbi:hypothetical protein ACHAWF_009075 [Thalassiosira exigua]
MAASAIADAGGAAPPSSRGGGGGGGALSKRPADEGDRRDLLASLACTLLELGVTLTASYFFSRWIARMVAGKQGGGGAGLDGEMDGFAPASGGGGVTSRLKKLLTARHEATVRAMAEEREDRRAQDAGPGRNESRREEGDEETDPEYDQLHRELRLRHMRSLSEVDALTPYEMSIAQGNVIDPSRLDVTFADVGGMDRIKEEIYDLVVMPLLRPDLFVSDSGLVSPPKGILLYGPPGTGKTMLAKAIAKESHATFVNVQLSTIMNKWFGESNKLISATFHLARKLAPSVVFIDEMDAFLSQRDGTEGSAVNSMKSEFLTLWDGLLSERKGDSVEVDAGNGANGSWKLSMGRRTDLDAASALDADTPPLLPTPPIIVLGATNRPYDVDPAILRRLPRAFEVPLPPAASRLQLLRLFLERQEMTPEARDFLPEAARRTEGYSGSDLKEVCRAAAWEPVREMTTGASRRRAAGSGRNDQGEGRGRNGAGQSSGPALKRTPSGFPPRGTKARPVNKNDFLLAIRKVKRTGESARQFQAKEYLRGREDQELTAADISRAAAGAGKRRGSGQVDRNGKGGAAAPASGGAGRGGKGIDNAKNEPVVNLDINQLLMAMTAAASMNGQASFGGHERDEGPFEHLDDSNEEDDDDVPQIVEDDAG